MSYPLPPYPNRASRPKPKTPHVPAVAGLPGLAEEFANKPLGGSVGEWLSPAPPPQLPPMEPLVIDPPPWVDAEGNLDMSFLEPPAPAPPTTTALEEMIGYDPPDLSYSLEPPMVSPPVERFRPEEPDWEEEREISARLERERLEKERQKIFWEELDRLKDGLP